MNNLPTRTQAKPHQSAVTFKRKLLMTAIASAVISTPTFAENNQVTLDNITIIGEKTERSLKDTTSSVSVIAEDQLNTMQYLGVNNAIADTVNLVVVQGTNPDIRGVSGNGSATGFNSFTGGSKARVARLVDGIAEPFVADLTGDTGLWDVEQIEVYRGPQSTTNGRNSIGGSLYIKTHNPSFNPEGKVRLSARNQDQLLNAAIMANTPIIADQLAFRIAAEKTDGDTFNKGLQHETNAPDFDLNELAAHRIRSKLLWQPAAIEGLSTMLGYVTSREQGNTGRMPFTADDPWKFTPVNQRYMDTQLDTLSFNLDYKISDGLALDILLADTNFKWSYDTYEDQAEKESVVTMKEDDVTFDAKLNVLAKDTALSGFIGLAHSTRSQDFNSVGATNYVGDDASESTALYGELYYQLSDQLTLTAGTRLQKEKQLRNFTFATRDESKLDREKVIQLPKLALQFNSSDNTILFVSARRGYNPGGGAYAYTVDEYYYFDEEFVTAFEIGSRSTLLDGKLNLSTNIFHNTYQGFQATNSDRTIKNLKEAKTYGAELEARWALSSELQLRSGLGLLESKITDSAEEYPEANGNHLNSAPGVTANVGGRYWFSHALSIDLAANYVGEYFGDFLNTKERKAGDYITTRLSSSYEQGNWMLTGFVNNLTNEEALLEQSPADRRSPDGSASIVDPRTVGISVTYNFL